MGENYLRMPLNNLIEVLAFVNTVSTVTTSINSSISNTVSLSENVRDTKVKEESVTQVIEILTSHGKIDETLFKKIRKWTMAYNNFVS